MTQRGTTKLGVEWVGTHDSHRAGVRCPFNLDFFFFLHIPEQIERWLIPCVFVRFVTLPGFPLPHLPTLWENRTEKLLEIMRVQ